VEERLEEKWERIEIHLAEKHCSIVVPRHGFSEGLNRLRHSKLVPRPAAEASEKACRIADDAAISRLRPRADGPNQWSVVE
jgi:hypothetical protein